VLVLADKGYHQALKEDRHLRDGLNVHEGKITCREVARDLGYNYVDPETALG
jgi:alanine dehydrogenase